VVGSLGTVNANRSRLQRLFENLLSNAVEHVGPTVTVKIGPLSESKGFYVADDGPGIPEAERERVLEYGYSTTDDGTGLGLGIVSEVAKAHGWDVTVTNSASGGTRFEITDVDSVA
jgi:signal transduction histidine kinase